VTTTVLVAGATGMLGSRIAAHLLDQTDVRAPRLGRQPRPKTKQGSHLSMRMAAQKQ